MLRPLTRNHQGQQSGGRTQEEVRGRPLPMDGRSPCRAAGILKLRSVYLLISTLAGFELAVTVTLTPPGQASPRFQTAIMHARLSSSRLLLFTARGRCSSDAG
jgi:hypothetical protein